MPSRTTRAKVKSAGKALKETVREIARSARAEAKKHGVKKSVTIIKGETVSKDKPTRIRILKKD